MEQPSKKVIIEKLKLLFEGKITREEVSEWAMNLIRNDNTISIVDVKTWHYLVAISNIDEMIAPGEYLFSEADIRGIMDQY